MPVSGGTGGPNIQAANTPQIGANEWLAKVALADDTAAQVPVPQGAVGYRVHANDGLPANHGSAMFTAAPANAAESGATGWNGANINLVTVSLAGTTSTDAKLSLGITAGAAVLYVENRLGSTKTITVEFF